MTEQLRYPDLECISWASDGVQAIEDMLATQVEVVDKLIILRKANSLPEHEALYEKMVAKSVRSLLTTGRMLQRAKSEYAEQRRRDLAAAAAAGAAAAAPATAAARTPAATQQPAQPRPPPPAAPTGGAPTAAPEAHAQEEPSLLAVALRVVGVGVKAGAPFYERRCAACGASRAGGSSSSSSSSSSSGGRGSAAGAERLRLTRCRGCGAVTGVRYCGAACARDHWTRRGHRRQCEAAQAALREARELVRQVEARIADEQAQGGGGGGGGGSGELGADTGGAEAGGGGGEAAGGTQQRRRRKGARG